jgi:hypothetical protein
MQDDYVPESSYYGSGISALAPCILCTNAIQWNTIHSTGGVPYIWGAIAGCIATIIFFKIKYPPILGEGIRVREKASQDRLILGGSGKAECPKAQLTITPVICKCWCAVKTLKKMKFRS